MFNNISLNLAVNIFPSARFENLGNNDEQLSTLIRGLTVHQYGKFATPELVCLHHHPHSLQ